MSAVWLVVALVVFWLVLPRKYDPRHSLARMARPQMMSWHGLSETGAATAGDHPVTDPGRG
jgi:hypothetical protein